MSARAQRKASEEIVEPWPRGISREPELSIGQLVERLKAEFPAITQMKDLKITSTSTPKSPEFAKQIG